MLLVDSQVLVWALDDSPRLGPAARTLIAATDGVYVSAATVWELTIKSMLGKLTVPADLASRVVEQGFIPLSVTGEHVEAIRDFPELLRHDRSIGCWSPRPTGSVCGWSRRTACCSTSTVTSSSMPRSDRRRASVRRARCQDHGHGCTDHDSARTFGSTASGWTAVVTASTW
jgi:PIN domain nuclease of toxin-antitoxin system